MTPEERARVLVMARLLRAAAPIQWLAVGVTLIAVAAIVQGHDDAGTGVAAVVLGLIAVFYGFRVTFDAKLFEDIATERLSTAELDHALASLRRERIDRSWNDRCVGAQRLIVLFAIAVLAQLVAVGMIMWS